VPTFNSEWLTPESVAQLQRVAEQFNALAKHLVIRDRKDFNISVRNPAVPLIPLAVRE
jgi:FPC/CPF motif-containing protein YcgG